MSTKIGTQIDRLVCHFLRVGQAQVGQAVPSRPQTVSAKVPSCQLTKFLPSCFDIFNELEIKSAFLNFLVTCRGQ
jgi:hypothetical protein